MAILDARGCVHAMRVSREVTSLLRDWRCHGGDVYAQGVSAARRMKDSLKCMEKCLYFGYN